MSIAPSLAVDIGEHSHGKHPHFAPISLSKGIPSSPAVIGYLPIGTHIMGYQLGTGELPYSPLYYFGRDFSLGTIDSNYPGTPFITQFLADP
jgi:hypothetical protein